MPWSLKHIPSLHNPTEPPYKKFSVKVLLFQGNSSVIKITLNPENVSPIPYEIYAVNKKAGLNVSRASIPMNFPTKVYFNFTANITGFSISINNGSYHVVKISGKS